MGQADLRREHYFFFAVFFAVALADAAFALVAFGFAAVVFFAPALPAIRHNPPPEVDQVGTSDAARRPSDRVQRAVISGQRSLAWTSVAATPALSTDHCPRSTVLAEREGFEPSKEAFTPLVA